MGMVGGGPGAFIGAIHRVAAQLDGQIELVGGAFSSDPGKSRDTGTALFLDPTRVYGSYTEMMEKESALPADRRMDLVSIVTPNHLHFEPARLAMESGFHVVLDKPIAFSLEEALRLKEISEKTKRLCCLTHTYAGYPMVKEARYQVAAGHLGAIRKVYVEYPQGWLSNALEKEENKQASWRTDPARSGIAGCMGDIGTHAFHLAEYVSGLKVSHLCAELGTFVKGRRLDDDGAVLLRFNNGATGVLMATQVAAGEENNIRIRVYGEKGGLEWQQQDNNTLLLKWPDRPAQACRAGAAYLSPSSLHNSRTPSGHPEGYLEAFANHYRNFALTLQAMMPNEKPTAEWLDFPTIDDGIRGMAFIENVVRSASSETKFIPFETVVPV